MKALLLCGGFATRLEPVTYFIPKPLLPVGIAGKPVVEYALEDVVRSGVMDITISTNAKFAQAFEYWIDQKRYDIDSAKMDLIIENTQNHNEKLGGVKGIMYAITEKKIDTDLIIIAGDNLYDFSVKEVIDYFNKHRKPTIAFYDIGSKEEAKRFGVAKLEGNKVVAFEEKPAEPQSTLVSTGIYIFPRESLSIIKEYLDQTERYRQARGLSSHGLSKDGSERLRVQGQMVRHRDSGDVQEGLRRVHRKAKQQQDALIASHLALDFAILFFTCLSATKLSLSISSSRIDMYLDCLLISGMNLYSRAFTLLFAFSISSTSFLSPSSLCATSTTVSSVFVNDSFMSSTAMLVDIRL